MWTREMLKTRAKAVLKKHYWMVFLVCLVCGLLGGSGSSMGSSFGSLGSSTSSLSDLSTTSGMMITTLLIVFWVVFLFAFAIGFAISVFVGNPIQVGLARYMMELRQNDRAEFGTIFWAFKGGRYMKVVKTMFFYSLYIFLWSLLFIIPGIIKAYEYCYVPYILAENPDIETNRVLQLSSTMTQGEKGEIFVLDLSFLGWQMLVLLATLVTCGIGAVSALFLTPYITATYAELYGFVRERAIFHNMTNTLELKGFFTPPPISPVYYTQPPYQNPPVPPPYGQPPAPPYYTPPAPAPYSPPQPVPPPAPPVATPQPPPPEPPNNNGIDT